MVDLFDVKDRDVVPALSSGLFYSETIATEKLMLTG
tara:strand:+ start:11399 stop:11506 length:108 start_codon:yes stop_codon:yes gene_type:complete